MGKENDLREAGVRSRSNPSLGVKFTINLNLVSDQQFSLVLELPTSFPPQLKFSHFHSSTHRQNHTIASNQMLYCDPCALFLRVFAERKSQQQFKCCICKLPFSAFYDKLD